MSKYIRAMLSSLAWISPWTGTCHTLVLRFCFVLVFFVCLFWWVCFWLGFGCFGCDFITAFWPATVHFCWPLNQRTAMYMRINSCSPIWNMQLNVLNDLAKAMKALDGKKRWMNQRSRRRHQRATVKHATSSCCTPTTNGGHLYALIS